MTTPQRIEKLAGPVNCGRAMIRASAIAYVALLFSLASISIGLTVAQDGVAARMFDYYDSSEEISQRSACCAAQFLSITSTQKIIGNRRRLGSMYCQDTTEDGADLYRLEEDDCVRKAMRELKFTMIFVSAFLFIFSAGIVFVSGFACALPRA